MREEKTKHPKKICKILKRIKQKPLEYLTVEIKSLMARLEHRFKNCLESGIFPGGPMAKILWCQCRSDLRSGNQVLNATAMSHLPQLKTRERENPACRNKDPVCC